MARPRSVSTKYEQVADKIRTRIIGGEWGIGERLPTADLIEEYDVRSVNTFAQAVRILRQDGLVQTRQGIGSWIVSLTPTTSIASMLTRVDEAIEALQEVRQALWKMETP